MKRIAAAISTSLFLVLLVTPMQTQAAIKPTFLGPIVPAECHCSGQKVTGGTGTLTTAPDFGCVMQTFQNTINFGVTFGVILFTLYMVLAGFAFITSGGSPESRSKAKTRLTNVLVGMAVALCAWLIVDYVMKTLYDPSASFGPWNTILAGKADKSDMCIVATTPNALSNAVLALTSVVPGTSSTGSGGGGCSTIPDSQLTTVDGIRVTTDIGSRFTSMKAAAAKDGVGLIIVSGYRSPDEQTAAWNKNGCNLVNGKAVCTTRTAAVPCSLGGSGSNHTRGTAIDIRLNSGVYAWLTQHAATYGFHNSLPNDLPHWSNDGR